MLNSKDVNLRQKQDNFLIPVSHLAEILYCPRNFYYRVVQNIEDYNEDVLEGRLQEERRDERRKIKRQDAMQIRSIIVSSEKLALIAKLDVLEENDNIYPVEYKKGVMRDNLNDDVQVCAQAMLLEEKLGREIPHAYIYYATSHARRRVELHRDLRELVMQTINYAQTIIKSRQIPEPRADNRCRGCSLINICMPEEVNYLKKKQEKPKRPIPGINLGRILYVDEPGAYIRKEGERLIVTKEKEKLSEMPLCNIDQVVLVGRVNLSTPAITLLLQKQIPTSFVSTGGKYIGQLQPAFNKNCLLRSAQYKFHHDADKSIVLSKAFVVGKLNNMRTFLLRYNRSLKDEQINIAIKRISILLNAVKTAADNKSLIGLEGAASREYFSVFGKLIGNNLSYSFHGRNRRPPTDEVNALLSFAYTLLTKDIMTALCIVGLDPYAGFLHESKYGRPALALDLMEEFRTIIGDSVTLTAINRGMIKKEDFYFEADGCYLTAAGRKKFYQAYEQRRKEMVIHPVFKYKLSYLRVFEVQARFLSKVIQNELDEYIPFMVR